jgi:ankyrin repeat protein
VRPYHPDPDYYEGRAEGLLASARDGTAGAVAVLARHDAPLTLEGARTAMAREHGFASWQELIDHLTHLDGDPFLRAYRAVEARDADGLAAVLDESPELVSTIGTNGNDLLGMASATCDERLVAVLLERGADVARGNVHGWTPLHQAAYGDLPGLARTLLEAGAPVDVPARGAGGTPLVVALFWGNRATAEVLAEHGVHPRNLRAAAGLGRLELADSAGADRGFYRPHSGFPEWQPSGDPQEVVDEALAWAARNDRVEALDALVTRGANVAADVYRGTALAWAAVCDRPAAIRRLVELGADPSQRGTFGGPAHGEGITALHLAAQGGRIDAVRALLDAGADPTIADDLYHGTPAGWAEHAGHRKIAELLRSHAG